MTARFKGHDKDLGLQIGDLVVVRYNDRDQIARVLEIEKRFDETGKSVAGCLTLRILQEKNGRYLETKAVNQYGEGWCERLEDYIKYRQQWLDNLKLLSGSKL